jgi:peptidyl-prolyl cis-trans isomerase A (cyclophilin A)
MKVIYIFLLLITIDQTRINAQMLPTELNLSEQSPDSFLTTFETTKGNFTIKVNRQWSPLASDRLYLLIKNHYYDDCVVYRVAPTLSYKGGFIVQFGIANDEKVNRAWEKFPVKDEPVVHPHSIGAVNFARGGQDTRSTELAIALTPCLELDTASYLGAKGFPTVGEVVEGMDVINSFNKQYGNDIFKYPDSLYLGSKYFDREFPGLDRIISARITMTW